MADPNWKKGQYNKFNVKPSRGLAVARMIAHITYLSELGLQKKFGRNLQFSSSLSYGFDIDFQIESYLKHQGRTFVNRFDANSYLYITKAMDYFDLSNRKGGLSNLFKNNALSKIKFYYVEICKARKARQNYNTIVYIMLERTPRCATSTAWLISYTVHQK